MFSENSRRHRGGWIATALMILLILAGAGGAGGWWYYKKHRAEKWRAINAELDDALSDKPLIEPRKDQPLTEPLRSRLAGLARGEDPWRDLRIRILERDVTVADLAVAHLRQSSAVADDPALRFRLELLEGDLRLAQDQPDAAIERFHKALEIRPDHSVARFNLGCALMRNWEEAMPARMHEAISVFSELAPAFSRGGHRRMVVHYFLGVAWRAGRQGSEEDRLANSETQFRTVLQEGKSVLNTVEQAMVHQQLAMTLMEMPKARRQDAAAEARKLLEQSLKTLSSESAPAIQAISRTHLAFLDLASAAIDSPETAKAQQTLQEAILLLKGRLKAKAGYALASAMLDSPRITQQGRQDAGRRLIEAMNLCTIENDPATWSACHEKFAALLLSIDEGDAMERFRQSLAHYEAALTAIDEHQDPNRFARIHRTIGDMIGVLRPLGADLANTQIAQYDMAMRYITHETFPQEWAAIQKLLSDSWLARSDGDVNDRLERAKAHAENALTVLTYENSPKHWLEAMNNLATVYTNRAVLDPTENYTKALETYSRMAEAVKNDQPPQWVELQILSAFTLSQIPDPTGANMIRVIRYFQQALTKVTLERNPDRWGRIHAGLGDAFVALKIGDRRENLKNALKQYNLGLQGNTRQAEPIRWATTHMRICDVLFELREPDLAHAAQEAIPHYQAALEVYSADKYPKERAMAYFSMGVAWSRNPSGIPSQDAPRAIDSLQTAAEAFRLLKDPLNTARAHMNLARAYTNLTTMNEQSRREHAADHYRQSIALINRQTHPDEFVQINRELLAILAQWSAADRDPILRESIGVLEAISTVVTRQTDSVAWAKLQYNLGSTWAALQGGRDLPSLKKSLVHLQQAFDVYSKQLKTQEMLDLVKLKETIEARIAVLQDK